MNLRISSGLFTALLLFTAKAADPTSNSTPLDFQEIYNLVRTNLSDVSEGELNNRAAAGLIKELGTRVKLVTTNSESATEFPDVITKRTVLDTHYAYIRIRHVDDRIPSEFQKAISQMIQSNDLKGIVLDLRYTQGTNYQAAAKVVDEFVTGGQPLLRYGDTEIASTDGTKAVDLPTAVLVNSETRGAAEAIPAMLRESTAALVIGKRTAGEARLFETFTLNSGQKLRVGKTPVAVGKGKIIPATGIEPDIAVTVESEEERQFYLNPYRERKMTVAATPTDGEAVTNRTRRVSEAELVRRHRDGFSFDEEDPPVAEVPVITDPTLARAIDFLKGIAILKPRRPL